MGVIGMFEVFVVVEEYFVLLWEVDVDMFVFGCIYYLFFCGVISYVMGEGVMFVFSDDEIVGDVYC